MHCSCIWISYQLILWPCCQAYLYLTKHSIMYRRLTVMEIGIRTQDFPMLGKYEIHPTPEIEFLLLIPSPIYAHRFTQLWVKHIKKAWQQVCKPGVLPFHRNTISNGLWNQVPKEVLESPLTHTSEYPDCYSYLRDSGRSKFYFPPWRRAYCPPASWVCGLTTKILDKRCLGSKTRCYQWQIKRDA